MRQARCGAGCLLVKPELTVLVTGVGGRSVGHQILEALRLSSLCPRIIAADADPFSYGLYVANARYVLPRADDPAYLDAVAEVVRRESIQAIFPGTEAETRVLARASTHFAKLGCLVVANPPDVIDLCEDKLKISDWLDRNSFSSPRSVGREGWPTLARQAGFPLVAKPTRLSGGSRHLALLASEEEVHWYLRLLPPGVDVMFQEYVEGPHSEFTVGVLVSNEGEIIDSIVLRRHLVGLSLGAERTIEGKRYALSTGYSQGFFESHPEVAAECERLALAIGARGPLNVQCRVSSDRVHVFEVHPRFSGTTSCRAATGFNEPEVLLRHRLFGERFGRLDYQREAALIRAFSQVLVPKNALAGVPRVGT